MMGLDPTSCKNKSMANNTPSPPILLLIFLLISIPTPTDCFWYGQWQTLFSLAHSLMIRVANLRASRGDHSGSERARLIAEKLKLGSGLGFRGVMWSMGWDYVKNYAWRDTASFEMFGAISDINQLLRSLNELSGMESGVERTAWVGRNYQKVLKTSKSLFQKLLQGFGQSGALRELVETVQREVVDGGLLRDCLELGSNDLKGLIQIFKDLALQFYSTSADERDDL